MAKALIKKFPTMPIIKFPTSKNDMARERRALALTLLEASGNEGKSAVNTFLHMYAIFQVAKLLQCLMRQTLVECVLHSGPHTCFQMNTLTG